MTIAVREARPEDVAEMHAMIVELAVYEQAPDEVIATEEDLMKALFGGTSVSEEFEQHESWGGAPRADTPTGHPAVYAHVIDDPEHEGKLAGMAIWFLNYSTWHGRHGVYLEDLYVRPQFRGKGFGKSLMSTLAQICTDNNYTRFQWWVLNWNTPAIDVYRALGAEAMDEWTVFRMAGEPLNTLGTPEPD